MEEGLPRGSSPLPAQGNQGDRLPSDACSGPASTTVTPPNPTIFGSTQPPPPPFILPIRTKTNYTKMYKALCLEYIKHRNKKKKEQGNFKIMYLDFVLVFFFFFFFTPRCIYFIFFCHCPLSSSWMLF